jgi:putative FmdB family regulatory protein
MPLYQFQCDLCEDTFDRAVPMAASRKAVRCECGGVAVRVFAAPGGHNSSCWPKESIALSVHSSQAKEASEHARAAGVNVEYKPDGTCVIPSRAEQKKLVALKGFFNKSAGYGD